MTADPERSRGPPSRPAADASARGGAVGYVWIAFAATGLHLAFDAITSSIALLTPPYLRLWDGPEEFRTLPPFAISVAASCVSGLIAVIATAALEPRHRRAGPLAALVTGFWLFSALLLRIVWLTTPWLATAAALLAGLPRGGAIGWAAARLAGGRPSGPSGGAA